MENEKTVLSDSFLDLKSLGYEVGYLNSAVVLAVQIKSVFNWLIFVLAPNLGHGWTER